MINKVIRQASKCDVCVADKSTLLKQDSIDGNKTATKSIFLWAIEAVVQRCSAEKVFLEILQNSQENNCARVSLIKLQASSVAGLNS